MTDHKEFADGHHLSCQEERAKAKEVFDIVDPSTWTNDMLYVTMVAAHDSELFNKVMEEHLERLTNEANELKGDVND